MNDEKCEGIRVRRLKRNRGDRGEKRRGRIHEGRKGSKGVRDRLRKEVEYPMRNKRGVSEEQGRGRTKREGRKVPLFFERQIEGLLD